MVPVPAVASVLGIVPCALMMAPVPAVASVLEFPALEAPDRGLLFIHPCECGSSLPLNIFRE